MVTARPQQAATTYAQLLNAQSDNNVKLIVLERLAGLKKHHAKVLQEVLMDILRALSSPNVDICRKTLEVAMDLVTPRNIEEVVQVRRTEVAPALWVLSTRADGVSPRYMNNYFSGGGSLYNRVTWCGFALQKSACVTCGCFLLYLVLFCTRFERCAPSNRSTSLSRCLSR